MTWKLRIELRANENNQLELVINPRTFGAEICFFKTKQSANHFLKKYLCFTKRDIKDFWEEEKEGRA